MFNASRNTQRGFSLVELMVVVAIIGVLAAIAVPQVNKYIAKARQSEAKTQLSAIYTSEKAFYAEYTAYDSRFAAIGYSPEGQLRYNVGYGAAGFQAGVAQGYNGAPAANFAALGYCGAAGVMANSCSLLNGATNAAPPAVPAALVTTVNTFTAGAIGRITAAGPDDQWTITHEKVITNTVNGIP